MEAALKQLEQFAANTDDIGRQNLRRQLRRLADSTEGVVTTIDRFGHRVREDIMKSESKLTIDIDHVPSTSKVQP